MNIQHEQHDRTGRFYIEEDGRAVAEMDYNIPAEKILLITHTEVDKTLAGKGIGQQLVESAVQFAREHSFHLKATCPFAKKLLDRTPQYADVYNAEKNI